MAALVRSRRSGRAKISDGGSRTYQQSEAAFQKRVHGELEREAFYDMRGSFLRSVHVPVDLREMLDGSCYETELQKMSVPKDKLEQHPIGAAATKGGQANGGFGEMIQVPLQVQQLDRFQGTHSV